MQLCDKHVISQHAEQQCGHTQGRPKGASGAVAPGAAATGVPWLVIFTYE